MRREVPLVDLGAQYAGIRAEIDESLARVVASQHFVLGPEVEAFEREFAAYSDTRFAVGCGSGSDALLLALLAIGVEPGDEVVCPAYSFFATASSISRVGGIPVFADIDGATYNLDVDSARQAADRCSRLKAILPVDLFGRLVDVGAFLELGREFGVPVIEDAAQAIGGCDRSGQRAGSRGLLGCFSLYPTKNLGAYGDAGIITTNDAALAERISALRSHGTQTRHYYDRVGINSRLDAIQAAVLRVKLNHLEEWTKLQREHAANYDQRFAAAGAVPGGVGSDLLEAKIPLGTPAPAEPGARHIYHQYVVRVPGERRSALRKHLAERGIETEVFYPLGLHQQACFASLGYREGDLPQTEAAARESLVLPIYPELEGQQLEFVVDAVVCWLSDHPPVSSVGLGAS